MSGIKHISINPNLKFGGNQYRNNNNNDINKPISKEYMSNIHPNIQVHKAGSYHNSQESGRKIHLHYHH